MRKPNDLERLYELGQSEFWVGYVHWRRRHLDEALARFKAYVDISEKLVDGGIRRTATTSSSCPRPTATSRRCSRSEGTSRERLERFEASLRIDRSLLEKTPDDNNLRWTVAVSNNSIGVVLKAQGRLTDALAHHQAELSLSEELVRRQPDNAQWRQHLGVAHNYVGGILEARGRMPEARAHYEQAIAICQALVTRDAANMDWQRELGRNHFRLGSNLLADGAVSAALRELGQAVSVFDRVAGTDRTNTGWQRDPGKPAMRSERRSSGPETLLAPRSSPNRRSSWPPPCCSGARTIGWRCGCALGLPACRRRGARPRTCDRATAGTAKHFHHRTTGARLE